MTTVITTHNLTRTFGEVTAVRDLNLDINAGEVVGVLGHNGAGKTTTVRVLNGLLAPTAGSVRVLGLDPIKDGAALRRQTGVLTETPAVDEKLTAREHLRFYGQFYGLSDSVINQRTAHLLESFELMTQADDRTGTFSKGMRQRLALARALLHNPQLLFLDEPTNGLDPVGTRNFHQTLSNLSRDGHHTIFLCTHNLYEAQLLCDRVAVLEHGQLIAYGAPRALARSLGKGVKLEIEVVPGDGYNVADKIASMPGLRDAEVAGATITLWLPERDRIPDIVHALTTRGVRILRVTPQEPTLADVYFALHENRDSLQE